MGTDRMAERQWELEQMPCLLAAARARIAELEREVQLRVALPSVVLGEVSRLLELAFPCDIPVIPVDQSALDLARAVLAELGRLRVCEHELVSVRAAISTVLAGEGIEDSAGRPLVESVKLLGSLLSHLHAKERDLATVQARVRELELTPSSDEFQRYIDDAKRAAGDERVAGESSPSPDIVPGDVVWLRGGSPPMTVESVRQGETAECLWIDAQGMNDSTVAVAALTKVKPT